MKRNYNNSQNKKKTELLLTPLTAISPLDGRYNQKTAELAEFVSEYGLIKARIEVEIHHLLGLSELDLVRSFSDEEKFFLVSLSENFTQDEAFRIKEIESATRHDVKAVELYLREKTGQAGLGDIKEFIHFGLTSEDVNNLAYRICLDRGVRQVLIPQLEEIMTGLQDLIKENKSLPMLARTHGQPAVPTTLGKEVAVFAFRIHKELVKLKSHRLTGKFSGAVGNFNALVVSYPEVDWFDYAESLVSKFGFESNWVTTQINTPEDIIEELQIIQRINGVILDFDMDMWRYISDDWFLQSKKKGEIGSSTMPQKVNPIDFENSEGNLTVSNGLIETMTKKLAVSRLQRDLSDSTTLRNLGAVLGYSVLGYKSLNAGLGRVSVNREKIRDALSKNWNILGEGVQTILRSEGVDDPYSMVSELTKGEQIGPEEWENWIAGLKVTEKVKNKLREITPESYTGLAYEICDRVLKEISAVKKG